MSTPERPSSTISLLDHLAGDVAVVASLHEGLIEADVDDWYSQWRPIYDEIRKKEPKKNWPESAHWDWSQKLARAVGLAAYRGFAVRHENVLQGLMLTQLEHPVYASLETKGRPIVYAEYIESAPWNQPWYPTKRFAGVGTNLIEAAVVLSTEEEFGGRVGLHALPSSEEFYRICGMKDFGPDDRHPKKLRYFEFTTEGIEQFRGEK